MSEDLIETLTNEDIIRLAQAGVSGYTIRSKIASSHGNYDTSVDALVKLAEAGVPDNVIDAMMDDSG